MTKQETPRSVRDMPAPYAVCAGCGQTPALMDPLGDGEDLCPDCSRLYLLERAAAVHLRESVAAVLGAWANHWAAAGVPHKSLLGLIASESGGYLAEEYAERFRREVLAHVRRQYRPEPYRDHVPERLRVNTAELPEVVRVLYPEPSRRPYFEQVHPATGERRQYVPGPGLDLLTLTLPDGSAVLIPVGIHGGLLGEGSRTASPPVRVPAGLLPAVLADWRSSAEKAAEGEA